MSADPHTAPDCARSGPAPAWLSMQETADAIGVPLSTLKFWRWKKMPSPTAHRVGRRILYRPDDVAAFVLARREGDTPQTGDGS